jgi:hypothetical protein
MKTKIQHWLATGVVALAAVLLSPAASADVPGTLTHQGRIYDANGAPVTATIEVVFTIYEDEAGTNELWKEARSVSLEDGYFSVALGEDTPIDGAVLDGSVRYLGVKVGSDPEMTPRAPVRSVPYALLANDVNGDITPRSISIRGIGLVIDENGQWVGDVAGLQGPAGPPGPVGPEGPAGPAGPPGMGNDMLFTRAVAAFGDTVATKDALCVAEFGLGFRAASTYNVSSLYRTEITPLSTPFTTSNYTTNVHTVSTSSGSAGLANQIGPATGAVACVRLTASLQFTRATAAFGDSVAAKDALCVAEFGPNYRTGSTLEVAASYRAAFSTTFAGGGGGFTVANVTTNLLAVTTFNGSASIGNHLGPATGPVACVSL